MRTAPYALVRSTLLTLPAETAPAAAFRRGLDRITELEAALTDLLPALGDALYESAAGHDPAFHREVVLPLRRALHNGRAPRPALLARLGDLPVRVPELGSWLDLRERRSAALAELAAGTAGALAAERTALSALCREPGFALAASYTSPDLLRAVERAGTGAADRKARKEEPGVLRQALRASTRTSPLSWFTGVGWGALTPPAAHATAADSTWGEGAGDVAAAFTGVTVKTNRTLVEGLCSALLADPRRRSRLPHRMTSTARLADGRATFVRSRTAFAGGRFLLADEDEVTVAATAPLLRVAELCATPAPLDELAAALAPPQDRSPALTYLAQLADAGLLVPVPPVGPQDPDPEAGLVRWLRGTGALPEDAALADRIEEIAELTGKFGASDPRERVALAAVLRTRWQDLLAAAGAPAVQDTAALTVLAEDVVARRPLPLDGHLDAADQEALRELSAVAEVFDLGHAVRRIVRDRFVARYGPGGTCHRVWEFGTEASRAWQEAITWSGEELAPLRAELVAPGDGPDADVLLRPEAVRGLGERLPAWATERPLSYAYFLQRDARDGLLCLNHVYGGWGRFLSRFLDSLDPEAARAVTREIRRAGGAGARPVQIRPVGGFNANLHPLLVADEFGADGDGASMTESAVELVHDEETDQIRVRLAATGELLDVFYPGLLAPHMLAPRIAPLLADQPHGVADFTALVPRYVTEVPGGTLVRTPRLRHRHVVLRRRRWQLAAGTVEALRAELAADAEVPVATTARWRALLGVPDRLFLHPVGVAGGESAGEEFMRRLALPKPQFVDLGNALHLRCLHKWLDRHPDGLVLEEALPAPGGLPGRPGPAVELVVETYRGRVGGTS
ncbi:lantibiotic dehydratase [Streptomyces sp. NPDC057011]|uniref:lantibiotic dehydratase n=1 Tax=unclassified Streptomyces TaxID=2593676 RepID=UPI003630A6B6